MRILLPAILLAYGNLAHAGFVQINTSFGNSTALLDTSTNVAWLHLTLTSNLSYDQVVANLGPGGIFDGWRYATPAEISTFFTDYDGGVVNDTLALALMNDLGGPLSDVFNPNNGFHRLSSYGVVDKPFALGHAVYGYIAVDNVYGPSINSNLQGSILDNFGHPSTGSWLVQTQDTAAPEPGSFGVSLLALSLLAVAKVHLQKF
jgi:hypothetical protein